MAQKLISSALLQKFRETKKTAIRLEIAVLSEQKKSPSEISRQLKVSRPTVYRWLKRYQEKGLSGLNQDSPRSGRKPSFSARQEQAVTQKANNTPPSSIRSLAKSTGLSYGITRRILLRNNLQIRSKKQSLDCNFIFEKKIRNSYFPEKPKRSTSAPSQDLKPNKSTITQKELGMKCGLSQATVSLALSASPIPNSETRIKVQKAARKLGYIPTPSSSSLANLRWQQKPRSTNVALLISKGTRNMSQELYLKVRKQAQRHGYSIDIIYFDEQTPIEKLTHNLRQRGTQGIILGQGIYKTTATKLKESLPWNQFTLLTISPIANWLNLIATTNHPQRVKQCMERAFTQNYQRITFLDLSETTSIQSNPEHWNSREIAMEVHFQKIRHHHKSNELPPLILQYKQKEKQVIQLTHYLQQYSPELILCDQDAGYSLLQKASQGLPTPAFISLNKKNKEDTEIAGLMAQCPKDTAERIIQCLDKQIRNNERGIPSIPTNYLPSPDVWIPGSSFPPKTRSRKELPENSPASIKKTIDKQKKSNRGFELLDLKETFNCSAGIREQWGEGKALLLQPGKYSFNEVPFQILPGDTDYSKNAFIMRSSAQQSAKDLPQKAILPIAEYCKCIHILHTSLWVSLSQTFATYRFVYEDDTEASVPLHSYGSEYFIPQEIGLDKASPTSSRATKPNIGDWHAYYNIESENLQKGAHAFKLPNKQIDNPFENDYLFTLTWKNPYPKKALKALHIESDVNQRTTLALFAITLEK